MKAAISLAARPYRNPAPGKSGLGYSRCVRSTCATTLAQLHRFGPCTRACAHRRIPVVGSERRGGDAAHLRERHGCSSGAA